MKRTARLLAVALAFATLTGCYYRVTDTETGMVYYTSDYEAKWSLGIGEMVRFPDPMTGRTVTLHWPKIKTISKADYNAAVGGGD